MTSFFLRWQTVTLVIGCVHHTDGDTEGQRTTVCIIGWELWVPHPKVVHSPPCQAIQLLPSEGCHWSCILYSSYVDTCIPASITELKTRAVCSMGGFCIWAETRLLMCEASLGTFPPFPGCADKRVISQVNTAQWLLSPGELPHSLWTTPLLLTAHARRAREREI